MAAQEILVLLDGVRIPVLQQIFMVMKKQGYREILRDRCPKIVNYALKWQKAKDAWIEHVYRNFIGIYVNKDDRNNATRIVLGLKDGKTKNFSIREVLICEKHFTICFIVLYR